MKICSVCNNNLPLTEFWSKGKRKQPFCIDCQKAYNKKRYYEKKEYHLEKVRRNKQVRHQEYNDWKNTLFCVECAESFGPCLDFHHIDPNTKNFGIGNSVTVSKKKFLCEIQKCVILCKNCHAKHHAGIFNISQKHIKGTLAQVGRALDS